VKISKIMKIFAFNKKIGATGVILLLILPISITENSNNLIKDETVDRPITVYGGPELDFEFIYKVVENLSNIIKTYPMGRDFGTSGEHYARDLVRGWMEEIGLQNVCTDKIGGEWTKKDSWQNLYNLIFDPDFYTDPWIQGLDLKKNFTKYYLDIKIYDKNDNLVDQRNFSQGTCFPFLKEEKLFEPHNVTMKNVKIFDEFQTGGPDGIILIEADWRDPYAWWTDNLTNLKKNNVKGFILMDCFDETIFMMPSGTSSPPAVARFSEPGFSINGSSGKWIKSYLSDPDYIVKADFCSEWAWEHVDSYNVIGEIPGNSSEIAIINTFYDGWWNQATCDQAASLACILGFAKYLVDNNIKPELTLKFIAWGGHEWYFRGAKHYLKNNSIKKYGSRINDICFQEDIIYVITPGNFGFNYTYDMSFNVGHERDDSLMRYMHDVANELNYTERTGVGVIGSYSVFGTEAWRFFHGHKYPERYCKHAIEFDRWPFPGYHRDGRDYTIGDVFSDLNDTLYKVDCEVISEIIYRLTVENFKLEITKPLVNSIYIRNKKVFSLPILRKTIVIGPIDITIETQPDDVIIDRVEFFVDNKLVQTVYSKPYSYTLKSVKLLGSNIKVVAYDKNGNYAEDDINII
jgi:hypothetical protein